MTGEPHEYGTLADMLKDVNGKGAPDAFSSRASLPSFSLDQSSAIYQSTPQGERSTRFCIPQFRLPPTNPPLLPLPVYDRLACPVSFRTSRLTTPPAFYQGVVHELRRVAGLTTADPFADHTDLALMSLIVGLGPAPALFAIEGGDMQTEAAVAVGKMCPLCFFDGDRLARNQRNPVT